MTENDSDLALRDWAQAQRDYLAERPVDGSIPLKQIWGEDTIARRAYEKYLERTR